MRQCAISPATTRWQLAVYNCRELRPPLVRRIMLQRRFSAFLVSARMQRSAASATARCEERVCPRTRRARRSGKRMITFPASAWGWTRPRAFQGTGELIMLPTELKQTVKSILEELARGQFESLIARVTASRLTADQLKEVIRDYGRTLVLPPEAIEQELDAVQVRGAEPPRWSVMVPLWTREEGRSDLTLELTVTITGSNAEFELDDLHVL